MLVFLNPDAVPEPDWLRNLIGGMQAAGRKFATSMITLQSDPQKLNSGGNLIHYLGLSYCRGVNAPRARFSQPELVSGASGAACAMSADLFHRIGGFDESFFLYHDDVDLSLRALLAGERCLYVPDAVVAHDYDLSVPPIKWGWVEAHRYAVLLKVFRLRTLLLLLPALMLIDLMTFAYLAAQRPGVRCGQSAQLRLARAQRVHHLQEPPPRSVPPRRSAIVQILSVLIDFIPYEQLAGPSAAAFGRHVADPLFHFYRKLCLQIINW